MNASRVRILVYGGTFDPPHVAHVRLPPLVADALNCARLLYVTARVNPLKTDTQPSADAHRLAMLTLALAENPDAELCTIELERDGPSYTIDTLRELHARNGPSSELILLIGADQALNFHEWKDWRQIIELAEPAVMLRPPWNRQHFDSELHDRYDDDEAQWWLSRVVDVPMIDVNAADLRHRLAAGGSVDGQLDPAVVQYIREHRLYAQQQTAENAVNSTTR